MGWELEEENASSNIVRLIKPNILKWASHVAAIEEGMSVLKILRGNPTGKGH